MRGEIGECLFLSDSSFSTSEAIDAGCQFDNNGYQISSDNSSSYDGGSRQNPSSYDSSSSDGTSSSDSYDSGSSGGGDYGGGGD